MKKPDLNKPFFDIYPEKRDLVIQSLCIDCKKKINEKDFKNEKSKIEYSISGLCQKCQDSVFK